MSNALYQRIYDYSKHIVANYPEASPISGSSLGMDHDIADTARFALENGDSAQVSVSRPDFRPPLEWRAELTFYIGTPEQYRHYLLMDDGTILHAIGKQIRPVEAKEAEAILETLKQLPME
jgi:hypothetical protein